MVFGITDARAYRKKVQVDLGNFMAAIADPYCAINACTSIFHLQEWLWTHNLKSMNPPIVRGSVLRGSKGKNSWLGWLDQNCPYFGLIQELTNGSKHASPVHSSSVVSGYGSGPYGFGPFGKPYLLIDMKEGEGTDRYRVASNVVREAGDFMITLSIELGA